MITREIKNNKNIILLLISSLIGSTICVEIVIPSFPNVSDYFNISDNLTQMILATNYFGYGFSSVIYGPLSEFYGRKKVMIFGNLVMLLGSLGCAMSESIYVLLLFRFIQGFGSSTSSIISSVIVIDVFSGKRASNAISKITSFLFTLVAFAPILGGIINTKFGWRGNYWIICIITLISVLFLLIFLPETRNKREKFNILFIIKNYIDSFSNKKFIYLAIALSVYSALYESFIVCAPFLYMETYKLSIQEYSLHQAAMILTFSITSLFVNFFIHLLGEKRLICVAFIISLLGIIILCFITFFFSHLNNIVYVITISMLIFAVGEAIIYPIFYTKSLEMIPNLQGTISSSLAIIKSIINGIFITIMSYFYDGSLLSVFLILLLNMLFIIIFMLKSLKTSFIR